MHCFINVLEIIGTISFSISGAMLGKKRNMDLFGVCVMGVITACGGGVLRDLFLGKLPPSAFCTPIYPIMAIVASVVIFLSSSQTLFAHKKQFYKTIMFFADSVGLGIFTVMGVSVALATEYGTNIPFVVFLGVITGVGGGVFRDILAGETPYIFVKHIYACATIAGALVCVATLNIVGEPIAMLLGGISVISIRIFAAYFKWNLPKPKAYEETELYISRH